MSYGIRVAELAGGVIAPGKPPQGQWLKSYDPEAHGGRGEAEGTWDAADALRFADVSVAWACWKQQSRTRPLRPDGKPNRPLTAYTVCIERLPEE